MMHYALVSDLMTREEFEERVEEKSAALGGVVDEVTAAMLVVEDLGRSHVKIGDIPKSEAGIVSFFGKISLTKKQGSATIFSGYKLAITMALKRKCFL